jgi:hypothetical protein
MESVRKYACGRYFVEGEPFYVSWLPLFLLYDLPCLPFWMQPPDGLCGVLSHHPNRCGLFVIPQERRLLDIFENFRDSTRKKWS